MKRTIIEVIGVSQIDVEFRQTSYHLCKGSCEFLLAKRTLHRHLDSNLGKLGKIGGRRRSLQVVDQGPKTRLIRLPSGSSLNPQLLDRCMARQSLSAHDPFDPVTCEHVVLQPPSAEEPTPQGPRTNRAPRKSLPCMALAASIVVDQPQRLAEYR